MLRFAPPLTLTLFLAPIGAGLIGTLLPAFGWFPPIGGNNISLDPWHKLFAFPGIWTTLRLTLVVGLGATILSFVLAAAFCALGYQRPAFKRLERYTAPLLATPHAAIAIGFAFLVLPSGWLARMLSPWLTGWQHPPALVTVRDTYGLAFMAGLLLKETPYLVLMMIAASNQVPAAAMVASARSMGYGRLGAWVNIVLPQIYPQIRLPVYAVLAFSLSVVDVAIILAPGNPPPLSVLAARWFADYDLKLYFPAAAAALLQALLVVLAVVLWRLGEIAGARLGRWRLAFGIRRDRLAPVIVAVGTGTIIVGIVGLLSIIGIALWSLAEEWRFPGALPSRWTLQIWSNHLEPVLQVAALTLLIGALASAAALALTFACLEYEDRRGHAARPATLWLLYLPLLVPQIALLFGIQVVLVRLNLDGSVLAVIWAHLLFVPPYVFLSLADPWRTLDRRYAQIAAALGATPNRTFWVVKLPMLLRPILVAFAVGFAVSMGQYLPTLFAGAGRVATLTTEAVTLSSGSDRRILGIYAVLQALMPLGLYGLSLAIPSLIFRDRRGLA
jgi:putative thiamine transport system permease protein